MNTQIKVVIYRLMFILCFLLLSVVTAKLCGRFDESTDERLRACYELETAPLFCVNSNETFWSAVIAQDRQIVRQFAELAALPGIGVPVCLNHWRRARCADAFPLGDRASVCRSTCQKLSAAACGAAFSVGGCKKPNALPTCKDMTSIASVCAAATTDETLSSLPFVRHSSSNVNRLTSGVYFAVCLTMLGLV